jgi:hypothetical protein
MTIALDRSKSYLRPSQLEDLVLAVVKAEAEDEDDAIEWKSTLDLQEPKAIGHHLARQIIGFANRMPGDAAKRYGGHGYLVVGASPGETKGIPPIDPAQLVQKLRPFLGGHLSWAPEFVTVGGARVMVIIIDPQQWRRFATLISPWDLPDIRRYDTRNRHYFEENTLTPFPSGREWYDGTWQTPLDHAFDVVDLHPRSEHSLGPLPLITSADTSPIRIHWEAASMNNNGVSSGVIELETVRFDRWRFDTDEMLLKRG